LHERRGTRRERERERERERVCVVGVSVVNNEGPGLPVERVARTLAGPIAR
jgi:hypothetical protein